MFQSQMRSQFPRHVVWLVTLPFAIVSSIQDYKPIPSPPSKGFHRALVTNLFQSQMRSKFPRHSYNLTPGTDPLLVSISDEKPVPSPPRLPRGAPVAVAQLNLRGISIADAKPVPSPPSTALIRMISPVSHR